MGCSNSSVLYTKSFQNVNDDIIIEQVEEYYEKYNDENEKKLRESNRVISLRKPKGTQDKEVIKWKIKNQNDIIHRIKYGYYKEGQTAITMKGADGAEKIKAILDNMRANPPKQIGKYNVIEYRDYKNGTVENYKSNTKTKTTLPSSNVLYFELDNDAWCCVRPSGTEPKIKFYIGVKAKSLQESENDLEELSEAMKKFE